MEIRAYLDTNLFLSYLLNPLSPKPPSTIVRVGLRGEFTILFGNPTIEELLRNSTTKPYLSARIAESDVTLFLETLENEGEHVRPDVTVIPAISRDRKDDYLLAYSDAGNATHLVSGDRDLLEIDHDFRFRIVSPAEFMSIIEKQAPGSRNNPP